MQQIHINRIIDYIALLVITTTGLFLLTNINYFSVPDPDIFQYITDTSQYMQIKLPQSIQLLPVYPILLGILTKFLASFPNPELLSACVINTCAASVSLALIYLIIRSYSRIIGLFTILLVATNQLYIFSSLNTNTEVLFTTILLLIFLLHKSNHSVLAYALVGISTLLRYEGLIVLFSIFIVDYLNKKKTKNIFRLCILALLPICVWLTITCVHNPNNIFFENGYVQEVISYRHRIPQYVFLTRIYPALTDYANENINENFQIIRQICTFVLLLYGIFLALISKNKTFILIYTFTLTYITFHLFFPFSPDRYLYPVLWNLYFALLWGSYHALRLCKKKLVFTSRIILIVLLSIFFVTVTKNFLREKGNYIAINASSTMYSRYYRHEVRLAADWLNSQTFNKKATIFTYEPWIMDYYTVNDHVSFFYAYYEEYQRHDSMESLIQKSNIDIKNNQILFIKQSNSSLIENMFPSPTNMNVKIFNNFQNQEEADRFQLLTRLSKTNSWVEIYEYLPKK